VKLLLDMNLPPSWVAVLAEYGVEAVHWSSVGDPRAADSVLVAWARDYRAVIFTHDLDFSAILAATTASGPSVVQVRTQDVRPAAIGKLIVAVLGEHEEALQRGALLSVDQERARVRLLPLAR
jgi:predicted nuclease of predicted toxin-antitoxin system